MLWAVVGSSAAVTLDPSRLALVAAAGLLVLDLLRRGRWAIGPRDRVEILAESRKRDAVKRRAAEQGRHDRRRLRAGEKIIVRHSDWNGEFAVACHERAVGYRRRVEWLGVRDDFRHYLIHAA